jgi:hypothetical protein
MPGKMSDICGNYSHGSGHLLQLIPADTDNMIFWSHLGRLAQPCASKDDEGKAGLK